MTDLVGNAGWNTYKAAINDGHDTFNQSPYTWKKSKGTIDRDGEDSLNEKFDSITLLGLDQYNALRTWPITDYTEVGALDKESEAVIFNLKYLRDLGYVNGNNFFIFDQNADRLIHEGIVYKCSGITNLSQAKDEPLLVMLVLQREVIPTQTT